MNIGRQSRFGSRTGSISADRGGDRFPQSGSLTSVDVDLVERANNRMLQISSRVTTNEVEIHRSVQLDTSTRFDTARRPINFNSDSWISFRRSVNAWRIFIPCKKIDEDFFFFFFFLV